ncbi:MAG: hypothetical protein QXO75_09075, partial [Nitrososphaerota archaeon]
DNVTLAMQNGTLLSPQALGFLQNNGTVEIAPISLVNIANPTTYDTNMVHENGFLYSNSSSYIKVNESLPFPSYVNLTLDIHKLPSGARNYIEFTIGNDTIVMSFINVSNGKGHMDLQLSSNFPGDGYYAWNDIPIPYSFIGNNTNISIEVNSNESLEVVIRIPESGFSSTSTFYYGSNNFENNPGFNPGNMVGNAKLSKGYILSLYQGDFPVSIYNFSVSKAYPIKYIIEKNLSIYPQYVNSSISAGLYGNYVLNPENISDESYVYFFFPSTAGWGISTSGDNSVGVTYGSNFTIFQLLKLGHLPLHVYVNYGSITQIIFPISLAEFILLFVILAMAVFKDHIKNTKNMRK